MNEDDFTRPSNTRVKYWYFGRRLSEGSKRGKTIKDMLGYLNAEFEEAGLKPINKGTASKLKTAYEVYVEEFGFAIEDLEDISAYDLYSAQAHLGGVRIVENKEDAKNLLMRLKGGEKFSAVRKFSNALPTTQAERFIEDVQERLLLLKAPQKAEVITVLDLTNSYSALVKAERSNPPRAEHLCREYVVALAKLYVDK